ncbi:MAG: MBL fold metallo-hydrolase [Candidatus Eisenbacteria bacterium]|uniref:MBL fold metallo-hydrolase n=1 Tax=Eiseniibacteriota bacterium TaxID=2212470 RepID=A0A948RZ62_UNCEI|nr:MBL fold metallo-hydrolase [Candidatus Eisenbacteria bacterium]MBU1978040.1 MBL fold metallo-hydrolase [Gammaproteobacteria bacterium]MBU2692264.1 MBL fold metallo-hydrolase [Candidatus Eisenbacteria bacterium]
MQITMIGHSTVLIETGGQKIITDPYFGVGGNIAYARLAPPAKIREEVRDVNLVLISHNHWDHTDPRFLRALGEDVPVLAPRWAKWLTKLQGAKTLIGMKAWEEKRFGTVTVTAVPALHLAVTNGYVIESEEKRSYFAGDTCHRPFMKEIGRRFQLDVALMPVTTFRIPMTMGEKGAVRAVRDLRPKVVIPIHLGIKPRSPLLRTKHSPDGFAQRVRKAGLEVEIVNLKEGESWSLQ